MRHPRDQKTTTSIALLITSDTRTLDEDETGQVAIELLESEGHKIICRDIIPNDPQKITHWLMESIEGKARVIITSGGTGIGKVDVTVDSATRLFDKEITGFGEHFRRLSYDEVGIPGLISRAAAGVSGKKLIFCLPGSKEAVKMALTEIILPGLGHMLWELDRR